MRTSAAHVSDWEDEDEVADYLGQVSRRGVRRQRPHLRHGPRRLHEERPARRGVKTYARKLAGEKGRERRVRTCSRASSASVPRSCATRGVTKPICANVDLYTGFVYSMLGIPADLYTPIFAMARLAGWWAHRMEELYGAARIIRPAYRPVIEPLEYKPLADR